VGGRGVVEQLGQRPDNVVVVVEHLVVVAGRAPMPTNEDRLHYLCLTMRYDP
jgi:hypothetical protein